MSEVLDSGLYCQGLPQMVVQFLKYIVTKCNEFIPERIHFLYGSFTLVTS